jgi:tetratricopeptide (TPR) repeat protein
MGADFFDFNDYSTLMDKAVEFYDDEKTEEAFEFLNRAYAIDKTVEAMLLYAKLYYDIGAFDCAIHKCYEIKITGTAKNDVLYEVNTLLFKIYFFDEMYDAADECFSEIRRLENEEDFVYKPSYDYDGIDAFLEDFKADPAFRIVDKDEENLRENLLKASLCVSLGHNDKAIQILKKDLEKNKAPRQYNLLVTCYVNSRKYALARKLAEKMLEYPETRLSGILNLLHWGLFRDDGALVEKCFSDLKSVKTEDEDDLEMIVSALTATNNHALVEEYVLKVLKYRPYDPEYLYHYACALYNTGRKNEAREIYKKIYTLYGDSGRAQFFLNGGKEMTVGYNFPLPFEYLNALFSGLDGAESDAGGVLLDSPESREMLYISLTVDEIKKDVLEYILKFRHEKRALDILKRFFLDVNAGVDFKEYAALNLIVSGTPFEFVLIARDGYGVLNYDGNMKITGERYFDGAYACILLRLLFHYGECGKEAVETKKYRDYIISLRNRLDGASDGNTDVKKEDNSFGIKNDGNSSDIKNDANSSDGNADVKKEDNSFGIKNDGNSSDIKNDANSSDGNAKVKKEDFRSERGIAAAVFYRVNNLGRGGGERVARLFNISSSTLRKFLKLIDKAFEQSL